MHGKRLLTATHKAEKVFKKYHGFSPRNGKLYSYGERGHYRWSPLEVQRLVGFYRKTKVPCSCYACGNPRKQGEIPIDELRAKEEFDNQMWE